MNENMMRHMPSQTSPAVMYCQMPTMMDMYQMMVNLNQMCMEMHHMMHEMHQMMMDMHHHRS